MSTGDGTNIYEELSAADIKAVSEAVGVLRFTVLPFLEAHKTHGAHCPYNHPVLRKRFSDAEEALSALVEGDMEIQRRLEEKHG